MLKTFITLQELNQIEALIFNAVNIMTVKK
jgi:hypothetical protein